VKQTLPFFRVFLAFLLALTLSQAARASDGIEIEQAHLEHTAEGYRLSSAFAFDLNHELEDALNRGIPLYFTTDVEITRPRWYWFDAKVASSSQTIRISYNVLTRQYHAAINGRLQISFDTLDDVLALVRRPNRWVVADNDALKPGHVYDVAVRMQLDIAQLPKPFQIHALNSSDWRLSTDWQHFTYKVEPQ